MTNKNKSEAGAIQLDGVSETLVASTERSLLCVCVQTGKRGAALWSDGTWLHVRADGRIQVRHGVRDTGNALWLDVAGCPPVIETTVSCGSHYLTLEQNEMAQFIAREIVS